MMAILSKGDAPHCNIYSGYISPFNLNFFHLLSTPHDLLSWGSLLYEVSLKSTGFSLWFFFFLPFLIFSLTLAFSGSLQWVLSICSHLDFCAEKVMGVSVERRHRDRGRFWLYCPFAHVHPSPEHTTLVRCLLSTQCLGDFWGCQEGFKPWCHFPFSGVWYLCNLHISLT